jgi:hypothetical protein
MAITTARGIWQVAFHVTGTLGADLNIRWTVPCDCTLLHASAVSSDANAFGINIGDSSDTDEYLQKSSAGVSNTPNEFDGDDWYDSDGNQPGNYYPHISAGTVLVIEVDYNYNGGGSAAASDDPTIVLTFAEG